MSLHLAEKSCRALGVLRIVAQLVAVLADVRSAAAGVGDDDVDLGAFEDVDHAPRQIERGSFLAGVHHQSAAAGLIRRRDHFAAFGRQHAHRGRVDLRHEFALDASQQKADAFTLLRPARE